MGESEMIERVATALRLTNANSEGMNFTELTKAMARAAIEAMRRPTKAMILAGIHHDNMGDMECRWKAMINSALHDSPNET